MSSNKDLVQWGQGGGGMAPSLLSSFSIVSVLVHILTSWYNYYDVAPSLVYCATPLLKCMYKNLVAQTELKILIGSHWQYLMERSMILFWL